MSYIKTISYKNADAKLMRIYDKVKDADGNIDNILKVHSLRPHTLTGHMSIYKNVLHNSNNTLPKWFLECIGVYVSMLNCCNYCVNHHFTGMQKLINNSVKSNQIKKALQSNLFADIFSEAEILGLKYAKVLTKNPSNITKIDVKQLKLNGYTDGEILEINQVTAYFNYANRTVLGLGVKLDGDVLGLSPNDSNNENNWTHQ